MKCEKCGFENLEEANFCIKCGHRLDGKIPCPKCGEYIPNESEHCPLCGKVIPHKRTSLIKADSNLDVHKQRASKVFYRVATYVSLFVFILGIILTCVSHCYTPSGEFHLDFVPTKAFIDTFKNSGAAVRTQMIISLSICVIDLTICLLFSILGVTKVKQAFKDYSKINESYKYMVIVFAARIVSYSLLCMNGERSAFNSHFAGFFVVAVIHLIASISFDCFLHFKKGRISIFIARIILGIGMFIPFLILLNISDAYYFVNYQNEIYYEHGLIQHFVDLTIKLAKGGASASLVSTYIFALASVILALFIMSIAFSFLVFYISTYFVGMNKFKKVRIAFYMINITLAILVSGFLIFTSIDCALYRNYLGESYSVYYGRGPVDVFILALLLLGVAVSTFNIYNRANKKASLEEKTSKID